MPRFLPLLLTLSFLLACSGDDAPADAGPDVSTEDAPTDSTSDVSGDSGTDTGADVPGGTDAGTDVPADIVLDVATDAPATLSRCDDVFADTIFCDGFEPPDDWDAHTGNVAPPPRPQTERVYRGMFSQRAFIGAPNEGNDSSISSVAFAEPVTSGTFHLRAYVHLESDIDTSSLALFRLGAGTPVFLYVGDPDQTLLLDGFGAGRLIGDGFPRDQWVCLQVALTLSDSDATAVVTANGTNLVSGSLGSIPGPVDRLSLGLMRLPPDSIDQDVTLDMDEVVVDTSPIPCD